MKTTLNLFVIGIMLVILNGCNGFRESSSPNKNESPEFKGKIAKTYEKSEEWWPKKKRPPKMLQM